jgi:tRNA A-37 threonylcarbamoyl transferase component Bud32
MVPQGSTPSNDPPPHSAAFVDAVAGAARGHLRADLAAPLGALLRTRVAQWTGLGLAPVKERTVRSVFRGVLGGVDVHVKVFRAHTLADRARDLLRGERGAHEHQNLVRLAGLGLPVVEPLGCGMADDDGTPRSFVVTRTVASARAFAFPADPTLAAAAGRLLRRLHDQGVAPGDLHPGNLLVDADGHPWLCDLTSVRIGSEVPLVQRARALAFFCHELDGGAQDAAAADLLAAYLDAGARLPDTLQRELSLATHRWRAAALPAFGRRATRSCRHTDVEPRRRSTPQWHRHLGAGPDDVAVAACKAFVAAPPLPGKSGRRGAVWLLDGMVVKQRETAAAQQLWRAHYWLLFAKVAAPTPIAWCRDGARGFVFVERLPGPDLAHELALGGLAAAALQRRARSLGEQVGRLHAHGLRNRDLKFENLVHDPRRDAVCMVDLDGVRRKSAVDSRGEGADLGRLLAAFRAAGAPGGDATLRTFLRGWLRAHRLLLRRPPLRRVLHVAQARASAWASAHAAVPRATAQPN